MLWEYLILTPTLTGVALGTPVAVLEPSDRSNPATFGTLGLRCTATATFEHFGEGDFSMLVTESCRDGVGGYHLDP
jgi:hypothetical protein